MAPVSDDVFQIIALVAAAAWPIVAVLALVLLREPLTTAIAELGRRTTKLDLRVVTFEFAQGIAPDWRVDVVGRTTDVRHLTSDAVFDAYSHSLFDQLAKALVHRIAMLFTTAPTAEA